MNVHSKSRSDLWVQTWIESLHCLQKVYLKLDVFFLHQQSTILYLRRKEGHRTSCHWTDTQYCCIQWGCSLGRSCRSQCLQNEYPEMCLHDHLLGLGVVHNLPLETKIIYAAVYNHGYYSTLTITYRWRWRPHSISHASTRGRSIKNVAFIAGVSSHTVVSGSRLSVHLTIL